MPSGENLYDIGSASVRWEDIWADQVYGRDVYVDTKIIHNGDTDNFIEFGTDTISISKSATFAGSITTNLSAEGTYFTGGSGGVRQLSITSGTNSSAHALHTFNIASSNGKYKFDIDGTEEFSIDSGGATFAGNVRVNGWIKGASDTNTLFSNTSLGTLLQSPTNSGAGANIYFRNNSGTVFQTFSQSDGSATFAGDVSVEDNLYLTDAGTTRAKIQLNSSDRDNLDIKAVSLGSTMNFFTADTLALSLDSSQNATFGGDVSLADSKKLTFGASDDLEIYHDGSNSYIKDSGTGNLIVNATNFVVNNSGDTQNMIIAVDGGATTLFCAGVGRLATTSTGVSVTGTILAGTGSVYGYLNPLISATDSSSDAPKSIVINNQYNGSSAEAKFVVATYGNSWHIGMGSSTHTYGNDLTFTTDASSSNSPKLRIATNGNATFEGDVTVGALTSGETAQLVVNHEGGSTPIASFKARTNRAQVSIADNDTTGYLVAEGSVFGIGRTGSLSANNINIDSSNNVGIGTSAPNGKLDIKTSNSGFEFFPEDSTDTNLLLNFDRTNSNYLNLQLRAATHQFIIDATERMRITSAGNVGIGTGGFAQKPLDVSGATGGQLLITSADDSVGSTAGILLRSEAGEANGLARVKGGIFFERIAGTFGNGDLKFAVNTSANNDTVTVADAKMTIDSTGNVLIGTTGTPNGTSVYGSGFIPVSNGKVALRMATSSTAAGTFIEFFNPNGSVGNITSTGSATAFNTSSDYRLKENVVEMTGALDRVAQLKPSRFNFIADSDTTVDGFLAHEVQSVVPEAITGTKDAMKDEEYEVTPAVYDGDELVTEAVMATRSVEDYQGIDQSKLVPLLVGAIQELRAEIELLKNK